MTKAKRKRIPWWRRDKLGRKFDSGNNTVGPVEGAKTRRGAAWWYAAYRYELAVRHGGNREFTPFPKLRRSEQNFYVSTVFPHPSNLPAIRIVNSPFSEFVDFEEQAQWSKEIVLRLDAPDDKTNAEIRQFKKEQRASKKVVKKEAKRRRDSWLWVELLDAQGRKGDPLNGAAPSKLTQARRAAEHYHKRLEHYFSLG